MQCGDKEDGDDKKPTEVSTGRASANVPLRENPKRQETDRKPRCDFGEAMDAEGKPREHNSKDERDSTEVYDRAMPSHRQLLRGDNRQAAIDQST